MRYLIYAMLLSLPLFAPSSAAQSQCDFRGAPPEMGQIACCCYDQWGEQCCAWVYVCPGPVPGCPCAY